MSTQPLNVPMNAQVLGIKANAASFTKSGSTVKVFCHACSLLLADEQTIEAQLCIEEDSIPWFKPNDHIQITLSDYKPGKQVPYTFKYIATLPPGKKLADEPVAKVNPVVRGTIIDMSLGHAVTLFSNMKIPAGKEAEFINRVVNTAIVFKDYYEENLL